MSWSLPLSRQIEADLFDARASLFMSRAAQNSDILIIAFEENSVRQTQVRSPLDRALLARALDNLSRFDPRAIGVDIAFDMETESDAALAGALNRLETPTFIAFLDPNLYSGPGIELDNSWNDVPEEVRDQIVASQLEFFDLVESDVVRQVSVNQIVDRDGVIRRWPGFEDSVLPSMASAMAGRPEDEYRGTIRFQHPEEDRSFAQLSIDTIADAPPDVLDMLAEQFGGRFILIGSSLPLVDRHAVTFSNGSTIPGVELHAYQLAQALRDDFPSQVSFPVIWAVTALVVLTGLLAAWNEYRIEILVLLIIGELSATIGLALFLEYVSVDTYGLPLFGWIAAWLIAFAVGNVVARSYWIERRIFVQGTLGRYLPRKVADEIIADPEKLNLKPEKSEIVVLFSDLEGFTNFGHELEPEEIGDWLNQYLETMANTVLDHGGTLDKFIGDAVVAFWGAPVAKSDDAKRALDCAKAMVAQGEAFQKIIPRGLPPVGLTRVGLHKGPAVVGNFGGRLRLQFTALGDAMNTAARLESANKQLGTTALVSAEALEGMDEHGLRCLGRVILVGRRTPVEVFEYCDHCDPEHVREVRLIYDRWMTGDESAVQEMSSLVQAREGDRALANFYERLRATRPGEAFRLDAK